MQTREKRTIKLNVLGDIRVLSERRTSELIDTARQNLLFVSPWDLQAPWEDGFEKAIIRGKLVMMIKHAQKLLNEMDKEP